jgi:hypothetical protein
LNKWSVNESAADVETTHFESVGDDGATYEDGETGKLSCEVEVGGFYDCTNTLESQGIRVGAILKDVQCYLDKNRDTLFYGFPRFRCLSVNVTEGVSDAEAKVTIKGRSKGQYVRPQ